MDKIPFRCCTYNFCMHLSPSSINRSIVQVQCNNLEGSERKGNCCFDSVTIVYILAQFAMLPIGGNERGRQICSISLISCNQNIKHCCITSLISQIIKNDKCYYHCNLTIVNITGIALQKICMCQNIQFDLLWLNTMS